MYDLVDRPLLALPQGSRFLLWAMRGWVAARARRACPPRALAPAFLKARAIDALPHFDMAMSLLNVHGRETLHFCCPHGTRIRESEAILLRLWSDLAHAVEARAIGVIELLVSQEAVPTLFSAMRAALPGLRLAGLDPAIEGSGQGLPSGG